MCKFVVLQDMKNYSFITVEEAPLSVHINIKLDLVSTKLKLFYPDSKFILSPASLFE
jgi:hypothetical protein